AVYEKTYDIIIPVYNGFKYLDRLFETIAKTKASYRLIIIDDNSSDERVLPYLEEIKDKFENAELIVHDRNLGFVKSVNEGLESSENDVVILNTDVELPKEWLERLAAGLIADDSVASATPFTNSGTICSFPDFMKDNPLFMDKTVDEADRFFRLVKPSYVSAPTGVGFCMAISRRALNETGLFDAEAFEKGYGEENDWCRRAIKKGFKNVIVENLFVFHNHGGSFAPEEKKRLLARNSEILAERYPDYNSDVAEYCEKDPHKRLRELIKTFMCAEYSKRSNLIFSHSWGGGAESYINGLKDKLVGEGEFVAEIIYRSDINLCCMEVCCGNFKALYALESIDFLSELKFKFDRIIINELVGYKDLYNVQETILKIRESHNSELIYLMHDYFSLCPSVYLLRDNETCCGGEADCSKCDSCLEIGRAALYPEYENTAKWREKWSAFLESCDEVRFFSEASKNIALGIYGSLNNFTVVPHKLNYMPNIGKKYKTTKTLNIGILGDLNTHKGLNIVKDMLRLITSRDGIRIINIGSSEGKIKDENYRETGRYTYDELPLLTLDNDIDVYFITSVWPETFCYTAEEAMKMGMPVMSFDIGAHAERIRAYEKGYVLKSFSAIEAIETAKTISLMPYKETKRVLFVSDFVSYCSRYRASHFMEQLLTEGIPSDFIFTSEVKTVDISKYESVVIHRSIYTDKLKKFTDAVHFAGKKVFFDVDDLVFNYGRIRHLDFLKEEGFGYFKKHTEEIAACMELCDGYLTSTDTLAGEIKNTFPNKPVCVNRNVLSLEMLTISNRAEEGRTPHGEKVILGYFSGSKTHDKDFELISDVLIETMEKYENVCLALGGFVDPGDRFERFGSRIIRFDFCDWKKLPYVIASVDINLMPLEESIFHECKSENKWTEAAAVGVCTVGSYNKELAGIIKNGVNGYLCSSSSEWSETLSELIENRELREQISERALNDVHSSHTVLSADKKACKFILE
ncbi:MAG: glycosyltransferase, partial [Clostridiales bacterium]|nr:glycosyltransferase [Clostridiales bacterium]